MPPAPPLRRLTRRGRALARSPGATARKETTWQREVRAWNDEMKTLVQATGAASQFTTARCAAACLLGAAARRAEHCVVLRYAAEWSKLLQPLVKASEQACVKCAAVHAYADLLGRVRGRLKGANIDGVAILDRIVPTVLQIVASRQTDARSVTEALAGLFALLRSLRHSLRPHVEKIEQVLADFLQAGVAPDARSRECAALCMGALPGAGAKRGARAEGGASGALAAAAADDYWESFTARRIKEAHATLETVAAVVEFDKDSAAADTALDADSVRAAYAAADRFGALCMVLGSLVNLRVAPCVGGMVVNVPLSDMLQLVRIAPLLRAAVLPVFRVLCAGASQIRTALAPWVPTSRWA